jgi:hypothetical protein
MDYLYYLGNASLVLRIVQYLQRSDIQPVQFMTVIHQLDGWVVKIRCTPDWTEGELANFQAFLQELGVAYQPSPLVRQSQADLEQGCSPVDVMRRYQVAVIAHGQPEGDEIETFRDQFIQGLGYCPQTLV